MFWAGWVQSCSCGTAQAHLGPAAELLCAQGCGRGAAVQLDRTWFNLSSSGLQWLMSLFPFVSQCNSFISCLYQLWKLGLCPFCSASVSLLQHSCNRQSLRCCKVRVRWSCVLLLPQTLQLLWKMFFALTQLYTLQHLLLGETYTAHGQKSQGPSHPQPAQKEPPRPTWAKGATVSLFSPGCFLGTLQKLQCLSFLQAHLVVRSLLRHPRRSSTKGILVNAESMDQKRACRCWC